MQIAVHGNVYDVTDFLPIHPGGVLIVSMSAGKDCSSIFDRVGHTSNGEVMSLLSNYLIGRLSPAPKFASKELQGLWEMWRGYLNICVEAITTISPEVSTLQNGQKWLANGRLDMTMARKLYQFQSRFAEQIIKMLFGWLSSRSSSIRGPIHHAPTKPAVPAER